MAGFPLEAYFPQMEFNLGEYTCECQLSSQLCSPINVSRLAAESLSLLECVQL